MIRLAHESPAGTAEPPVGDQHQHEQSAQRQHGIGPFSLVSQRKLRVSGDKTRAGGDERMTKPDYYVTVL
jgi:hypothetical protein